MATAQQQARYRARDSKRTVEVRLLAEALARLDRLVGKCGAAGRGEVIEALLLAQGKGASAGLLLNEGARLVRSHMRATGRDTAEMRDGDGFRYVFVRSRTPA